MPDLNSPSAPPTHSGPAPPPFEFELRHSDRSATWIGVSGELAHDSVAQFEQAMRDALSNARLLIIDLRQLTGIDDTGAQVILDAHARARRSRRRLVFVRGAAEIDRLLERFGLSDRLEIVDIRAGAR